MSTGIDAKEHPPQLTQLNTSLGTSFTGETLYRQRSTRFNAAAAAFAMFVISYLAIRARRLELASALHAGAHKTQLTLQMALESVSWIGATVLCVTPVAFLSIGALNQDDEVSVHLSVFTIAAAGLLAALLAATIGTAMVREQHLFKFFKER